MKHQVVEKGVFDENNKELPIGTVINISFKRAKSLINKVKPIIEEPTKEEQEVVTNQSEHDIDLSELTKDELYEKATELEIEGRSEMNKQELVEAIEEAEAELEVE